MKVHELKQNARQYINGRWETSGTTGISQNPSNTREAVAEYARADRNQAELAIRAAAEALPQWSHSGPQRRADALDQIGSELLARKDELGNLLAREEGRQSPADWAAFVNDLLQANREKIVKDGKPLATPQETLADVTRQVELFAARFLPIYQALRLG